MKNRRTALQLASALCAVAFTGQAFAQSKYPDHPVKVIVALAAGGSVDAIARTLGQKLNTSMGQPFVVDNRAGASGQIGMPAVAKSPADGYTLTVSPASFSLVPLHITGMHRAIAFAPFLTLRPFSFQLMNEAIGLSAMPRASSWAAAAIMLPKL